MKPDKAQENKKTKKPRDITKFSGVWRIETQEYCPDCRTWWGLGGWHYAGRCRRVKLKGTGGTRKVAYLRVSPQASWPVVLTKKGISFINKYYRKEKKPDIYDPQI